MCKVNVGEPECAISFGGRKRKSVIPVDVHSKSGDYDIHVVSLTPSVTLIVDFDGRSDMDEEKRMIGFYRGFAYVSVKDSIF